MSNVVPIPARGALFTEPAGRAGDWWEPISVDAARAVGLADEAAKRRLPLDLLASLVVEHALVERDIAESAVDKMAATRALDAAVQRIPASGPGCLHTSYIRMLGRGDGVYEPERDDRLAQRDLMLPLRLHQAASSVDIAAVCRLGALDEAIAWEIAAASSGQFMREWALRVLLVDFAA